MSFNNMPGGCCCLPSGLWDWYEAGGSAYGTPQHYLRNYDYLWRSGSVKVELPDQPEGFEYNSFIDGWYIDMDLIPYGDFDRDGDVDGADFLIWQRDPNIGDLGEPLRAKHKGYHGTTFAEDDRVYCARWSQQHIVTNSDGSSSAIYTHYANEWHDDSYNIGMEKVNEQNWIGWITGAHAETTANSGSTWLGINRPDPNVPTESGYMTNSFFATDPQYQFRTILRSDSPQYVRMQIGVSGGPNDGHTGHIWFDSDGNTTDPSNEDFWDYGLTRVSSGQYELLLFNILPEPDNETDEGDPDPITGLDLSGSTVHLEYRIVDALNSDEFAPTTDTGLFIDWHSIIQTTLPVTDYVVYSKNADVGPTSADNGALLGHYMADTTQQLTYTYPKTALDRNVYWDVDIWPQNWLYFQEFGRLPNTTTDMEDTGEGTVLGYVSTSVTVGIKTKNISDMMLIHSSRINGRLETTPGGEEITRYTFAKGYQSDWGSYTSDGAWGFNQNGLAGLGGWKHEYNAVNPFAGLSMGSTDYTGVAMSTYSPGNMDAVLLHSFSGNTTEIISAPSAYNFVTWNEDALGAPDSWNWANEHGMRSILYPREDYTNYEGFQSYTSHFTNQTVDCQRGNGVKENSGPKDDAQIVMTSTRLPGWAWMIKDARDNFKKAPNDSGRGSWPGEFYSKARVVSSATHSVSIGLGKIIKKSSKRYRGVGVFDADLYNDAWSDQLESTSHAWISSSEDYLTGSTGSWWRRIVTDDKLITYYDWSWVGGFVLQFGPIESTNLKSYYPPEGDVQNRPLVWANLNWADVGTISNAASGVDHSGYAWEGDERRYKAAIIQWGKATPAYIDSRGNHGEYPSEGKRYVKYTWNVLLGVWDHEVITGGGVGWKRKWFNNENNEEPAPGWWTDEYGTSSGPTYWGERSVDNEATPIDHNLTYKYRNGDIVDIDDFGYADGTIIEYFLCVAGATKGSSSSHELYESGILKEGDPPAYLGKSGCFEMPIWRIHAAYWGDPNERDDDSNSTPKPRTDNDSPGDECWYWGLHMHEDLMLWFERLGDNTEDSINDIVWHTGSAFPDSWVLPGYPDLPGETLVHLSPELPDYDVPGGVPIGWRMHSLNKTTGKHYTLDTEWPHPIFWERTLEKDHINDHEGVYEPQRLFPEIRGVTRDHIYVGGFVLTDTRLAENLTGVESGINRGKDTNWVMTHDLSWMWPVGEEVSGPDPSSSGYPDGQWIGGGYPARYSKTDDIVLPKGSQSYDTVKIPDELSPSIHQYANRIPTRKYGNGPD